MVYPCYFFFLKQKTAYEIGLGIPAEPLFRSISETSRCVYYGKHQSFQATAGFRDYAPNAYSSSNGWSVFSSEERRVGKSVDLGGGRIIIKKDEEKMRDDRAERKILA